jgi:hypothetical protein
MVHIYGLQIVLYSLDICWREITLHRICLSDNLLWIITPFMLLREAQGMSQLQGQLVIDLSCLQRNWPYVIQHSDHSSKLNRAYPDHCGAVTGSREELTAQWGHGTSNQHSWLTASLTPHSFLPPHVEECAKLGYNSNSSSHFSSGPVHQSLGPCQVPW